MKKLVVAVILTLPFSAYGFDFGKTWQNLKDSFRFSTKTGKSKVFETEQIRMYLVSSSRGVSSTQGAGGIYLIFKKKGYWLPEGVQNFSLVCEKCENVSEVKQLWPKPEVLDEKKSGYAKRTIFPLDFSFIEAQKPAVINISGKLNLCKKNGECKKQSFKLSLNLEAAEKLHDSAYAFELMAARSKL